jgi:hypothetical protein
MKIFPSISIYEGLYVAGGCSPAGVIYRNHTRNFVSINNPNAEKYTGVSSVWYGVFTFFLIQPKKRKGMTKNIDISMSKSAPGYTIETNKVPVSPWLLDELLEAQDKKPFVADTSMQRTHEWGPLSRMPKGFTQVKSGKVMATDYYWDDYNSEDGTGSWTRCDVSYSSIQPGKKIEKSSIRFVNLEKKTSEVLSNYNEFVIRKRK